MTQFLADVVVHVCNPNTMEAEAYSGLNMETQCLNKERRIVLVYSSAQNPASGEHRVGIRAQALVQAPLLLLDLLYEPGHISAQF